MWMRQLHIQIEIWHLCAVRLLIGIGGCALTLLRTLKSCFAVFTEQKKKKANNFHEENDALRKLLWQQRT